MHISQSLTIWFLLIFFLSLNKVGKAQNEQYKFEVYDTRQGLPSSIIECAHQTKNKLLWVAHSVGISRFDGYQFEHYAIPPDKFENYQIEEDGEGDIWVKSNGQLFLFDGKEFQHIVCPGSMHVLYIYFDDANRLWVVGESGIYTMQERELQVIKKHHDNQLPLDLIKREDFPITAYVKVEEDGHGGVFISRNNELFHFSSRGTGSLVHRFPVILTALKYWKSDGSLLVGTKDSQLLRFRQENGQPVVIPHYQHSGGLAFIQILPIDDHSVWVHREGGLFQIDLKQNKISESLSVYRALDISRSLHVIEDGESGYWYCTDEGLVHAVPRRESFISTYPALYKHWKSGLFSVTEDGYGNLLLGGNHHLLYTFNGQQVAPYPPFDTKGRGEIFQLFWDHFGYLWIVTGWAGIKRWDGKKWEALNFNTAPDVHSIFEDSRGFIWIGNQDGGIRFQNKEKIDSVSLVYLNERHNLDHLSVKSFAQDRWGTLWIGTNEGLLYFDYERQTAIKAASFPESCDITKLKYDNQGNKLWIASLGKGVICFEPGPSGSIYPQTIRSFRQKDGLISNYFLDLVLDDKANAWMATYGGISAIQYDKGQTFIINYPLSTDWLNRPFINIQLFYHAAQKEIFGATLRGLFSFKPGNLQREDQIPEVEIVNLKVDGIDLGSQTNWSTQRLKLNPGLHEVQFTCNIKNFLNKEGLRYEYHLIKNDQESNILRGSVGAPNSIHYTALGPGEYKFKVNAMNASGVYSISPAQLSFYIRKPLYEQLWFRLILLFSIFGVLSLIILFQRNERIKAETERLNAILQLNLSEERHAVQRLRANPHFVSNAIGSIQNLIRKGEFTKGIDYLNKFYELQRSVLDMATKPLIKLEEEFAFLELYLSLENLRFSDEIDYKLEIIEVDEAPEEVLETLIPQFILQPFVENAIHHGLRHKTSGQKKLSISASVKADELICIIEDNGIGRGAAARIKQIRMANHRSHGIEIAKSRLRTITLEAGQRAFVEIQDMESPLSGTRVKIVLPSDLS